MSRFRKTSREGPNTSRPADKPLATARRLPFLAGVECREGQTILDGDKVFVRIGRRLVPLANVLRRVGKLDAAKGRAD
jgi:hypothetical protein